MSTVTFDDAKTLRWVPDSSTQTQLSARENKAQRHRSNHAQPHKTTVAGDFIGTVLVRFAALTPICNCAWT